MFSKFKYERISLSLIKFDYRNPRIVMQQPPVSDEEVLTYFFEHEDLAGFLKKIASEGRNPGAERPYVVKSGKEFVVVEGNTRIAAYKLLTGQLKAPEEYASAVPHIPQAMKDELVTVDCSIAPSRDSLLSIMANAHFGRGDKSRWSYLGSRKEVFEEWKSGKSFAQLAAVFERTQSEIRDLLIEYQLYLEALKLDWTDAEKAELLRPEVAFNPPVRFLQSTGHKSAVGIDFDKVNIAIVFSGADAKSKFKHLISKLVVATGKGLSATSSFKEVFADYVEPAQSSSATGANARSGTEDGTGTGSTGAAAGGAGAGSASGTSAAAGGAGAATKSGGASLKKGALFNYTVTTSNALIRQLMKEAKSLNTQTFPASGTALLRSLLEAILKTIVDDQGANPQKKQLDLEGAINLCLGIGVKLNPDDKRVLKEFKNHHLDYVNLGTHATVIPNALRLKAARDCVDQFVMRNV